MIRMSRSNLGKVSELQSHLFRDVLPAVELIPELHSTISTLLKGNGLLLEELKSLKLVWMSSRLTRKVKSLPRPTTSSASISLRHA